MSHWVVLLFKTIMCEFQKIILCSFSNFFSRLVAVWRDNIHIRDNASDMHHRPCITNKSATHMMSLDFIKKN
jgi:hypothetical protein